jgi:DNA-binding Xre family transcriptional regulator
VNTRIDRFKVRTRMDQLGIETYQELAKLAGVSEATVYNSLDGYNWRSQTLDALATALRCAPTDIITFGPPPTFTNALVAEPKTTLGVVGNLA